MTIKFVFEEDGEPISNDEPTSDEEFEDSDGSIQNESEGEEYKEYDMDHWSNPINLEYGVGAKNMGDGRKSAVDGSGDYETECTVNGETQERSTFVLLSLQNLYADIRSDEGFYAVAAAPVFDEFDDKEHNFL